MATHDDQRALLDAMSRMGSAGRAESEDAERLQRSLWPVPEHLRAFDPDVVLVIGPRGAGKTELFRAVIEFGLLSAIARRAPEARLSMSPPERTRWLAGHPIGAGFPSPMLLAEYTRSTPPTGELFEHVWLAYLVRVLRGELEPLADDSLAGIFAPDGGDIESVVNAFRSSMRPALLILDRLDERLSREGRYVFVAYDELDTLARGRWDVVRAATQGLVGLWASHTRRWRRLRGKVFLRTDLYERAAGFGGADFAKLAGNRAELAWSDRHLYAMLVRRLANSDDGLREYCAVKLRLEEDTALGWFPVLGMASDARQLVERMVGPFMGANERKGLSFRWLLDHIRDGRGQALPRPLVRLIEAAADIQRQGAAFPRWPRLLEPRALRRALDKVSEEHVGSALDEWPWLAGLKRRLAPNREVPWERREIERQLSDEWDKPWYDEPTIRPPADSPRELIDYLVEVGVFRARSDGRIDAPDLFLAGLGLKRKGGVRRK